MFRYHNPKRGLAVYVSLPTPQVGLRPPLGGAQRISAIWSEVARDQIEVIQVLSVYLCGAFVITLAVIGGAIMFSDPRNEGRPLTRVAFAVLAGALWPVVAVMALLSLVIVPLLV